LKATNLLLDYVCIAFVDNADIDESTDQKSIELEYGHLLETPNSWSDWRTSYNSGIAALFGRLTYSHGHIYMRTGWNVDPGSR
jgi:hypothetical protein